jgi:hypothetical protein
MMRRLSFFTGGFGKGREMYEMCMPHRIAVARVKIAIVAGVRMADPKFGLRVEYSSATVSRDQALACRERRIQQVLQDPQYLPTTKIEQRRLH